MSRISRHRLPIFEMMTGFPSKVLCLLVSGLAMVPCTQAGPPFLTDDPEPVELHHWEAYLFATGDHTADGNSVAGPAVEANYGIITDTQLHLVVPVENITPSGAATVSGLGDVELGVKYRFVHETDTSPQAGIFPMIELPTGNSARGLGNGRTWFRLPLWIQKSWGAWTSYGGGGVVLNSAPGERNHPFGGWLVQRDCGTHLNLGGEIFSQGSDSIDGRGFTAVNFGGSYSFTPQCSLLFSAGRSVRGEHHTLWYLALYRTWGPVK